MQWRLIHCILFDKNSKGHGFEKLILSGQMIGIVIE